MKWGMRLWKTALAATLATYIVQLFGFHHAYSAGLLAILGVEVTRKRAISTITQRFIASLIGLCIGSFILFVFGVHIVSVGIFVLTVFPILNRLNLREGMITSSVIIFHVFSVGKVDWPIIFNELMLLIIGFGAAALVNLLYMPGSDNQLVVLRKQLESAYAAIFTSIANNLRNPNFEWDGADLIRAEAKLNEGIGLARLNKENQMFRADEYWFTYFSMRSDQWDAILRMLDLVSQVYAQLPHGEMVAQLFDELSEDVQVEDYTGRVERDIEALQQRFKQLDLPVTRAEFEVRSAILQLMTELKHYLSIAKKDKKSRLVK
jgi:uncharacterized membrane protein YgaE (UPF0421/DUF939 family)